LEFIIIPKGSESPLGSIINTRVALLEDWRYFFVADCFNAFKQMAATSRNGNVAFET
jgi:hypothetical protein